MPGLMYVSPWQRSASAVSLTTRGMASNRSFCTCGLIVRIVPVIFTSGAMMLLLRPPWIVPIVTTAESEGASWRLTSCCSDVITWAAAGIGSMH